MQTENVDPNIVVTVRHEDITDSLRQYATDKINGIHLDYPRIIEAKAILDVEGSRRHKAEIILFCANHIVIDASSETEDMYKSIDFTIDKITRRMRKHKTRLLKKRTPRKDESIRYLDERNYRADFLDTLPDEVNEEQEPEPFFVHKESFSLRKLYKEEAVLELDLTERPFVVFANARRNVTSIVWRKRDGEYGMVDIPEG
jgi:putative sigma-54 modulation protein